MKTQCDCGAGADGVHSTSCALVKRALGAQTKRDSPSEAVTWKRIGTERACSACGRKLKLRDVIEFGTRYENGEEIRYVYCDCRDRLPADRTGCAGAAER